MTKLGKLTFALAAALGIITFSGAFAEATAMPNTGNIGKQVSADTVEVMTRARRRHVSAAERRRIRIMAKRETDKLARAIKRVGASRRR